MCVFESANTSYSQTLNEIESLVIGAEYGDMTVVSGKGSVFYNYARIDSLSEKAKEKDNDYFSKVSENAKVVVRNTEDINVSFAFSGIQVRCDEISSNYLPSGRKYTQEWKWAFNGEKTDHFSLDGIGHNGLIIPKGSIRTEYVTRIYRFDPRYNGMKIFDTPIGNFLKGSLGDMSIENISVNGEEVIDNIPCKIITGHVSNTSDSITVWIAPSIMYRPKKIEYISLEEITVINNFFKQYETGIWFPNKTQQDIYYIDTNTNKRVLYSTETITVKDDFNINIELPSTMFEIMYPSKMKVFDYRLGEKIQIK